MELGPLGVEETGPLLVRLAGGEPGPTLASLAAGAGGNPGLLEALVRGLEVEGRLLATGGVVDAVGTAVPRVALAAAAHRVTAVPGPARAALRTAALLGERIDPADLATALGSTLAEVGALLGDIVVAGEIEVDGPDLVFRHPMVRAALVEAIPDPVRRAQHRDAALRLTAAGRSALVVAGHLLQGAGPGDVEAVGLLRTAATGIARTAPAMAVELLEHALSLTGPTHGVLAAQLRQDLVPLLLWVGRLEDCVVTARRCLHEHRLHPGGDHVVLHTTLASALVLQGLVDEALAAVVSARSDVHEEGVTHIEATVCSTLAAAGRLTEAVAMADRATVAARAGGDLGVEGLAAASAALFAVVQGRYADGGRAAGEALSAVGAVSGPSQLARLHLGLVLTNLDRFPEARGVLADADAAATATAAPLELPLVHTAAAVLELVTGHWDAAAAHAEQAKAEATEMRAALGLPWSCGVLGQLALRRGDLRTAAAEVEAAGATWPARRAEHGWDWVLWTSALLREAGGDLRGAIDDLVGLVELFDGIGVRNPLRFCGPDLVRLAQAAGDRPRVGSTLEAVERLASDAGAPASVRAVALRCRAMAAADPHEAVGAAMDAVDLLRPSGRAHELGLAIGEAAGHVARSGDAAEGRRLLGEAAHLLRGMGAERDTVRLLADLRSQGVRTRLTETRTRPSTGWAALTASERAVVDLAREGLSNPDIGARLFISRRTVAAHLGSVYRKLGIASRLELLTDARPPT